MKVSTIWQIKKIGEVAKICLGLTHTPKYVEDGIPFLSVKDISQGKINFENTRFITNTEFNSMPDGAKPKKGDVLFCRVGTIGYPQILDQDNKFGIFVSLGFFRVNEEILLNKYIYYWMKSQLFYDQVKKNVHGSTLKNLNTGWLKDFDILLPPKPEQQRIVRILDNAFEKIDKIKQNTERNIQNFKEILESYKNELFSNKGKPFDKEELKDVCEKITQGPNPKYDKNESNKFRVLKTKNLYDNKIFYEEADKISKNVFDSCISSELKNGDVLIAIVGQGSINKCNVIENKTNYRFIYTRALGLIRTKASVLNPYYLKAFFQSKEGKNLINSGIGGASGQQIVTTTYIKALKIPIPPVEKQNEIVKKLDELSEKTKRLETTYKQKLADLEEFKKSILNKAFRGEL